MGKRSNKIARKQAQQIYEAYKEKFNEDFENNKKVLTELGIFQSKRMRNVVAGIITNLAKKPEL